MQLLSHRSPAAPPEGVTVVGRSTITSGRGRDVETHWVELRHRAGRFHVACGAYWHSERHRGRERTVHSTDSLRGALDQANRRIASLERKWSEHGRIMDRLDFRATQRLCIQQGLVHVSEDPTDVLALEETLFA